MSKKINIQPVTRKELTTLFQSEEFKDKIYEALGILRGGVGESGFSCARSIYDNRVLIGKVIFGDSFSVATHKSLEDALKEAGLSEINGTAYPLFRFHFHPEGAILKSYKDLGWLCRNPHETAVYGHKVDSRPIIATGINLQEAGEDYVDILLLQRKSKEPFTETDQQEISDTMDGIPTWLPYDEMVERIKASKPGRLNCEVIRYVVQGDTLTLRQSDQAKLTKFAYTPVYLGFKPVEELKPLNPEDLDL